MSEPLDFLAVGAHPDDCEICAGGLLAKLKRQGYRTGIADLTHGESGTYGDKETRKRESDAAKKILDLDVRVNAGLPDAGLSNTEESRRRVIDILRRYQPRLVCGFRPQSPRHPDHGSAGRIVTDVCFLSGLEKLETGLPPYKPAALMYFSEIFTDKPDFIVDITAEWDRKLASIKAFGSQVFDESDTEDPRTLIKSRAFLDAIEARARYYGAMIGVRYAETFFYTGRMIIDDVVRTFCGPYRSNIS